VGKRRIINKLGEGKGGGSLKEKFKKKEGLKNNQIAIVELL
jgi:hypothetical protein